MKQEVKGIRTLEHEIEDLKKSLQTKTKDLEEAEENAASSPFAVVLIDGDGYIFPDELLCQGGSGGEEAAQRLLNEVRNYLSRFKGAKEWRIVVRIFANLEGLGRKFQSLNIVNNTHVIREFAAGFVQSQALFDIIDVGYGKERADHKIRGQSPRNSYSPSFRGLG